MLFAIPATLNEQQQGYYFTFSSLLGLQIFFELGLNQVITQIVSKEVSLLSTSDPEGLHLDRLRSVMAILRRWYAVAAALFFLIASLIGVAMFQQSGTLPWQAWAGPWIALTAVTAVNLFFSSSLAVSEGCGSIGQVARLRLIQSLIGYALVWAALFSGLGLWAIPFNAFVASICTFIWLRHADHGLGRFRQGMPSDTSRRVDWRREVLPFQWRIAASWISGYLMYQLFTPLVFVHLGPAMAGRLGITLAIFLAIQSVGVSWISARLPSMTRLITLHDGPALRQLFRRTMFGALGITAAGCVLVVALVVTLGAQEWSVVQRLTDLPTLIAVAIATFGNTLAFGLASFMRAHGEEPMLPPSIAAGVLTLAGAYVASTQGTFLTILVQALVTFVVLLPWTFTLFTRYWQRAA